MNRTEIIIDALAPGAKREMDALVGKEKQVVAGMKEVAKEAKVMEYAVADAARNMRASQKLYTEGGAYLPSKKSYKPYEVTAASRSPSQMIMPAGDDLMPYGVSMPRSFSGNLAARFIGRDQGQHTDPHAARLAAQAVAEEVRSSSQKARLLKAETAAKRELAAFELAHAQKMAGKQAVSQNLGMLAMGAGGLLAAGGMATIDHLQMQEMRSKDFNLDFRKIGSLGSNMDDMGGKRSSVLAYSNAWGVASEEIIKGMYSIESAASNLSKTEQRELMVGALQFNRLQGTGLEDGGKAILKYKEIYSDSVQSISQAKNRLFKVADLGDLDIDKAARFMPDLLSRGKAIGYTDTDVGAMTVVGTQKLGRTEKTLTSLGDVMMKIPDAAKRLGFAMTGTLADLDALGKFKPTQLLEVFGTDVGTLKVLMDNRKEIANVNTELLKIGPTSDEVGGKMKQMFADIQTAVTETNTMFAEFQKNMPATAEYAQKWGASDESLQAKDAGWGMNLGPMFSWLSKPAAWADQLGIINDFASNGAMQAGANFGKAKTGGEWAQGMFGMPFTPSNAGDSMAVEGRKSIIAAAAAGGRTDVAGFDASKSITAQLMEAGKMQMAAAQAQKEAAEAMKGTGRGQRVRNAHTE